MLHKVAKVSNNYLFPFSDCEACEDMKKCSSTKLTYELCQTNREIERSCPKSCCAQSSLEGYINRLGSPKYVSK